MTARQGLLVLGLALVALLTPAVRCGAATPVALKDGLVDRSALRHDPNGLDQVLWTAAENPRLRFLSLRVAFRANDVRTAGVRLYLVNAQNQEGFRDHEMEHCATTDSSEIRTITLPFEDDPNAPPNRTHWRGYRFWFDDGAEITWLGSDTTAFREDRVARYLNLFRRGPELSEGVPGVSDRLLVVPGWAQDAVVLPLTLAWRRGQADSLLAGELQRLRRGLRTLDTLGVTTLLVDSPGGFPLELCWPPDATGDAAADSVRAATSPFGRLQSLCDAAHRRRMKIMVTQSTIPGDDAATDSLLGLVRQGIGCGVDGFQLHPAPGTPEGQWRAVHETARALLPEVYLVLDATNLGTVAADPARWTIGSRVDALRGQGVSRLLADWLDQAAPLPTGELDRRLDLRRLATPTPLARVDWIDDPYHGAEPNADRWLFDLMRVTLPGAVEVSPARLDLTGAGEPAAPGGAQPGFRALLRLRREHPALRRGGFTTLHADGHQFAYLRRSSEEILLAVINRDEAPAELRLPLPRGVGFVSTKDVTDILSGARYPVRSGEILLKGLSPRSGAVIVLR